jgi:hypothetical protein
MLNVSSVLISMAPLWVILLGASSAAAYLVFWRKAIKYAGRCRATAHACASQYRYMAHHGFAPCCASLHRRE